MKILYWLPAICVGLHVFEEFVWPGGFLPWYRAYRPELAASLTVRFIIIVNVLLLLFALLLAAFGANSSRGVSAWLALMAALACNGIFHVRGMIRSKQYSPGVATGVLLYIPLCAWGYWFFVAGGFKTEAAFSPLRLAPPTSFGPYQIIEDDRRMPNNQGVRRHRQARRLRGNRRASQRRGSVQHSAA
jgi:hypothetical protein